MTLEEVAMKSESRDKLPDAIAVALQGYEDNSVNFYFISVMIDRDKPEIHIVYRPM